MYNELCLFALIPFQITHTTLMCFHSCKSTVEGNDMIKMHMREGHVCKTPWTRKDSEFLWVPGHSQVPLHHSTFQTAGQKLTWHRVCQCGIFILDCPCSNLTLAVTLLLQKCLIGMSGHCTVNYLACTVTGLQPCCGTINTSYFWKVIPNFVNLSFEKRSWIFS